MSITIMPVAGSRACTRRHAVDSQLHRPAPRYYSFAKQSYSLAMYTHG
jgi:hypothetical protein